MADALCGPSNALQNFQKHVSSDRTLQQDRLASRTPLGQDFRSTPSGPSARLDAEFQAFQAAPSSLTLHQEPAFFQQQYHGTSSQNHKAPAVAGPDWAADFQQINLDGPRPQLASASRHSGSAWHKEFAAQQSSGTYDAFDMYQNTQVSSHPYMPSAHMQFAPQPYQQGQRNVSQAPEILFDEAAFERAFESARSDVEARTAKDKSKEATDADDFRFDLGHADTSFGDVTGEYEFEPQIELLNRNQAEPYMQPQSDAKIGSDTISPEQDIPHPERQADDLARTAGQLLDSLKHEQSSKFQKSNFLELMRQIRDKEIHVEDGKMVPVHESAANA